MPVDPKTGKKLPYNSKEEEYMAAAKNNMPAEEGPPMEEPPMDGPPMDGPPKRELLFLLFSLRRTRLRS